MDRFLLITPRVRTCSNWVGSVLIQNPALIYENDTLESGYKPRGTDSKPLRRDKVSDIFD